MIERNIQNTSASTFGTGEATVDDVWGGNVLRNLDWGTQSGSFLEIDDKQTMKKLISGKILFAHLIASSSVKVWKYRGFFPYQAQFDFYGQQLKHLNCICVVGKLGLSIIMYACITWYI